MVRVGVLTSSRADFGVYLPLLKAMEVDEEISFEMIVFGTHLSNFHGYTINDILTNQIAVKYQIPTLLAIDNEEGISTSTALCSLKFSTFWANHKNDFDLVLCLGDRYEMFAAVSAGVPFGIKFAHFYGGDISLGAIDNVYRDCLTHMSSLHFTSTNRCAERVKVMKNNEEVVEQVGILSLDDINDLDLESMETFKQKWQVDLQLPTILLTVHPETVRPELNVRYADVLYQTCLDLSRTFQLVITMPNADTDAHSYREKYNLLKKRHPENVYLIENFGRISYFTCMKHSLLMMGNTSSGISEAASFNKYFINIGDRQKGREVSLNILSTSFNQAEIIEAVNRIVTNPVYYGENIYEKKNSVKSILRTLKEYLS